MDKCEEYISLHISLSKLVYYTFIIYQQNLVWDNISPHDQNTTTPYDSSGLGPYFTVLAKLSGRRVKFGEPDLS